MPLFVKCQKWYPFVTLNWWKTLDVNLNMHEGFHSCKNYFGSIGTNILNITISRLSCSKVKRFLSDLAFSVLFLPLFFLLFLIIISKQLSFIEGSLRARHWTESACIVSFNPHSTSWGRNYYPHFIVKGTNAPGG